MSSIPALIPRYQTNAHDDTIRQYVCSLPALLRLVLRFLDELGFDRLCARNLQHTRIATSSPECTIRVAEKENGKGCTTDLFGVMQAF